MKQSNTMKTLIATLMFGSLAFANTTYADGTDVAFYGGIGAYKTSHDQKGITATESGITFSVSDVDYSKVNLKLLLGAKIDDNFAVEAHYLNLGKDDISTATITDANTGNALLNASISVSGKSFGIAGLLYMHNNSPFQPFAKLGFHSWDLETEVDFTITAADGSSMSASAKPETDGNDLFYGVGVDYDFDESIAVRAEYEIYKFDDDKLKNFGIAAILTF